MRRYYLFFFKQTSAYDMRISDWSSYVCSSDLLSALGVRRADHGAFLHQRMQHQHGFDLGAGDVVAGRDNHVVGARLVPEIAVLVADIGVAGEVPAVLHIGGLAFRIVEIATAGGAAHRQPADRAGRTRLAALVDHARTEE